jgi:ABC-type Na+ efflux pump permease subunit
MPRQNIIFAIVAPLILMAIIAAIVISIGETLLAVHHWAEHYYHVGEYPTPEQNRYARDLAALPSVFVALAIATAFLVGGAIASRLAPQPKHH